MNKFKAGDKVYCLCYGTNVYTVEHNPHSSKSLLYPIKVDDEVFTESGRHYIYSPLQEIFHATPENHTLLEQLYGVEFEKPPAKPTSHEIIAAMLERGDRVSDTVKEPSSNNTPQEIHCIEDGGVTYYVDTDGNAWFFATPFDPRTNEPITELPE